MTRITITALFILGTIPFLGLCEIEVLSGGEQGHFSIVPQ